MQLIKNSGLNGSGNLEILLKGNDKFTQPGPLKGKKLPVDVLLQLGEDFFGIQAKNFQSSSFLDEKKRSYTTKLNSGEFSFSSAEKESIINVYFNSSYSKGSDPNTVAANIAKAHGPELLRLAQNINTGAETDRNNFFFIDGTYLVPGSVIFQIHIDDLKASGPSPINNDEGFAPVPKQRHPLFIDYWRYPKGKNSGDMIAVENNAPTVSSIGSAVEFNITFILSMD